jgi:hypothetical protein
MPSVDPQPTCLCPPDGRVQLLAKANNNLVILLNLMSSGTFTGQLVNLGECQCSEAQILAAFNNNLYNALSAILGGGGLPVDASITSWAQLAAVATADLDVPVIKIWREAATSLYHFTILLAGTDATDTANGIQRPNDYAAANHKVWYQQGSAG